MPSPPDVVFVGNPLASAVAAAHSARRESVAAFVAETVPSRLAVLTPLAVRELELLSLPTTGPAWHETRGLRVVGGGSRVLIDWPRHSGTPDHGLVCTDLLKAVREHALACGAQQIVSVPFDALVVQLNEPRHRRAQTVVSARFRSPRHDDDWVECWPDVLIPSTMGSSTGTGWLVGAGDGSTTVFLRLDSAVALPEATALLTGWLAGLPGEWALTQANQLEAARLDEVAIGLAGDDLVRQLRWGRRCAEELGQGFVHPHRPQPSPALTSLALAVVNQPVLRRQLVRYGLPRTQLLRWVLSKRAAREAGGDFPPVTDH